MIHGNRLRYLILNGILFSQTDIDFVDSRTGYECTYDGRVFKTTDGQETWKAENFPSGINNYALDFVNQEKGWIFGSPGTNIIRDPYYVSVANDFNPTPSDFILYQNYPNPFNPSTTIDFNIPETGFVTMKIYDIIGNEIAVLVNEQ